jgi:hypothetical protein
MHKDLTSNGVFWVIRQMFKNVIISMKNIVAICNNPCEQIGSNVPNPNSDRCLVDNLFSI